MPRPKTFDPEFALTKAMEVFRQRGYGTTVMREIARHVGISRSSMYATFGDKRRLFLDALRHSAQKYRTAGLPDLATARAPRESIIDLFEPGAADAGDATPPHIMLLVRTALELVPDDPDVSALVRDEIALIEDNLRHGIERGVAAGEISSKVNAAGAACALLSLYLSVHLMRHSKPVLHSVASQVEALLPPPQPPSGSSGR